MGCLVRLGVYAHVLQRTAGHFSAHRRSPGSVRFSRRETVRWLALAGGSLGLALLTRVGAAAALPAFGAYVAMYWRTKRLPRQKVARQAFAAAAAFSIGVGLMIAYNLIRFGNPFDFGYHTNNWQTPLWSGLYGLTLSPGKGILWYAPVVLWAWLASAPLPGDGCLRHFSVRASQQGTCCSTACTPTGRVAGPGAHGSFCRHFPSCCCRPFPFSGPTPVQSRRVWPGIAPCPRLAGPDPIRGRQLYPHTSAGLCGIAGRLSRARPLPTETLTLDRPVGELVPGDRNLRTQLHVPSSLTSWPRPGQTMPYYWRTHRLTRCACSDRRSWPSTCRICGW